MTDMNRKTYAETYPSLKALTVKVEEFHKERDKDKTFTKGLSDKVLPPYWKCKCGDLISIGDTIESLIKPTSPAPTQPAIQSCKKCWITWHMTVEYSC